MAVDRSRVPLYESIAKRLGSGVSGIGGALAGFGEGALTALGSDPSYGVDSAASYLRTLKDIYGDQSQRWLQDVGGTQTFLEGPDSLRAKYHQGNLGVLDVGRAVGDLALSQAPQLAFGLGSAKLGTTVLSPLAKRFLPKVSAEGVSLLSGGAGAAIGTGVQEAGSIYNDQAEGQKNFGKAAALGFPAGALEAAGMMVGITKSGMGKYLADELAAPVAKSWKQVGLDVLAAASSEATTEGAQTVLEQSGARPGWDVLGDVSKTNWTQVGEAAIGGAIFGGGATGIAAPVQNKLALLREAAEKGKQDAESERQARVLAQTQKAATDVSSGSGAVSLLDDAETLEENQRAASLQATASLVTEEAEQQKAVLEQGATIAEQAMVQEDIDHQAVHPFHHAAAQSVGVDTNIFRQVVDSVYSTAKTVKDFVGGLVQQFGESIKRYALQMWNWYKQSAFAEQRGSFSTKPIAETIPPPVDENAEFLNQPPSYGSSTFKDVPVVYTDRIVSNNGLRGMAQRVGNEIRIDQQQVDKGFENKIWTTPQKQVDGSMPTALPKDTFKSAQEFEEFLKAHEYYHDIVPKQEGMTAAQHEDAINQVALDHVISVRHPAIGKPNEVFGKPAEEKEKGVPFAPDQQKAASKHLRRMVGLYTKAQLNKDKNKSNVYGRLRELHKGLADAFDYGSEASKKVLSDWFAEFKHTKWNKIEGEKTSKQTITPEMYDQWVATAQSILDSMVLPPKGKALADAKKVKKQLQEVVDTMKRDVPFSALTAKEQEQLYEALEIIQPKDEIDSAADQKRASREQQIKKEENAKDGTTQEEETEDTQNDYILPEEKDDEEGEAPLYFSPRGRQEEASEKNLRSSVFENQETDMFFGLRFFVGFLQQELANLKEKSLTSTAVVKTKRVTSEKFAKDNQRVLDRIASQLEDNKKLSSPILDPDTGNPVTNENGENITIASMILDFLKQIGDGSLVAFENRQENSAIWLKSVYDAIVQREGIPSFRQLNGFPETLLEIENNLKAYDAAFEPDIAEHIADLNRSFEDYKLENAEIIDLLSAMAEVNDAKERAAMMQAFYSGRFDKYGKQSRRARRGAKAQELISESSLSTSKAQAQLNKQRLLALTNELVSMSLRENGSALKAFIKNYEKFTQILGRKKTKEQYEKIWKEKGKQYADAYLTHTFKNALGGIESLHITPRVARLLYLVSQGYEQIKAENFADEELYQEQLDFLTEQAIALQKSADESLSRLTEERVWDWKERAYKTILVSKMEILKRALRASVLKPRTSTRYTRKDIAQVLLNNKVLQMKKEGEKHSYWVVGSAAAVLHKDSGFYETRYIDIFATEGKFNHLLIASKTAGYKVAGEVGSRTIEIAPNVFVHETTKHNPAVKMINGVPVAHRIQMMKMLQDRVLRNPKEGDTTSILNRAGQKVYISFKNGKWTKLEGKELRAVLKSERKAREAARQKIREDAYRAWKQESRENATLLSSPAAWEDFYNAISLYTTKINEATYNTYRVFPVDYKKIASFMRGSLWEGMSLKDKEAIVREMYDNQAIRGNIFETKGSKWAEELGAAYTIDILRQEGAYHDSSMLLPDVGEERMGSINTVNPAGAYFYDVQYKDKNGKVVSENQVSSKRLKDLQGWYKDVKVLERRNLADESLIAFQMKFGKEWSETMFMPKSNFDKFKQSMKAENFRVVPDESKRAVLENEKGVWAQDLVFGWDFKDTVAVLADIYMQRFGKDGNEQALLLVGSALDGNQKALIEIKAALASQQYRGDVAVPSDYFEKLSKAYGISAATIYASYVKVGGDKVALESQLSFEKFSNEAKIEQQEDAIDAIDDSLLSSEEKRAKKIAAIRDKYIHKIEELFAKHTQKQAIKSAFIRLLDSGELLLEGFGVRTQNDLRAVLVDMKIRCDREIAALDKKNSAVIENATHEAEITGLPFVENVAQIAPNSFEAALLEKYPRMTFGKLRSRLQTVFYDLVAKAFGADLVIVADKDFKSRYYGGNKYDGKPKIVINAYRHSSFHGVFAHELFHHVVNLASPEAYVLFKKTLKEMAAKQANLETAYNLSKGKMGLVKSKWDAAKEQYLRGDKTDLVAIRGAEEEMLAEMFSAFMGNINFYKELAKTVIGKKLVGDILIRLADRLNKVFGVFSETPLDGFAPLGFDSKQMQEVQSMMLALVTDAVSNKAEGKDLNHSKVKYYTPAFGALAYNEVAGWFVDPKKAASGFVRELFPSGAKSWNAWIEAVEKLVGMTKNLLKKIMPNSIYADLFADPAQVRIASKIAHGAELDLMHAHAKVKKYSKLFATMTDAQKEKLHDDFCRGAGIDVSTPEGVKRAQELGYSDDIIDCFKEYQKIAEGIYEKLKAIYPDLKFSKTHYGQMIKWYKKSGEPLDDSFDYVLGDYSKLEGRKEFLKERDLTRSTDEIKKDGLEYNTIDPHRMFLEYVRDANKLVHFKEAIQSSLNTAGKNDSPIGRIYASEAAAIKKGYVPINDASMRILEEMHITLGYSIVLPDGTHIQDDNGKAEVFETKEEAEEAAKDVNEYLSKNGMGTAEVTEVTSSKKPVVSHYVIKEVVKAGKRTILQQDKKNRTFQTEEQAKAAADALMAGGQDAIVEAVMVEPKAGEVSRIYFQKDMARMLNVLLAKDKFRRNKIGDFLMKVKNLSTLSEFAFSAFHAMTITQELTASYAASSWLQKGTGPLAKIPLFNLQKAKVESQQLALIFEKLLEDPTLANHPALKKKAGELLGFSDPDLLDMFRQFVEAGGLMHQDADLKTVLQRGHGVSTKYTPVDEAIHITDNGVTFTTVGVGDFAKNPLYLRHSIKEVFEENLAKYPDKHILSGGLTALYSATEATTAWLMEYYIPRVKMACFMREYALRLKREEGNINSGLTTKDAIARDTMKFVEDRFGEVNWKTLWMDPSIKSALQFLFRSFTWFTGSWKAFGKAGSEFAQYGWNNFVKGGLLGKKENRFYLTEKGLWAVNVVIAQMLMAQAIAIAFGTFGDDDEEELKDKHWTTGLLFPRIDTYDKDSRVAIPSYVTELYKIMRHVGAVGSNVEYSKLITGRFNSVLGRMYEVLWTGQDWRGIALHEEDDGFIHKQWDNFMHVAQIYPISFATMSKAVQAKGLEYGYKEGLLSIAGFTKAPAAALRSEAVNVAFRVKAEEHTKMSVPEKKMELNDEIKQAGYRYMRGDKAPLNKMRQEGKISDDKMRRLMETLPTIDGKPNPRYVHELIRAMKTMTIAGSLKVWPHMTDEEKKMMRPRLIAKFGNAMRDGKHSREELMEVREKAKSMGLALG